MLTATRSRAYVDWRVDGISLHRQGAPDHLIQALDYLMGKAFVTGQILTVEGGEGGEGGNNQGCHSEHYPTT